MTVNLESRYLGMTLRNPLVVSANPLGREVAMIERLEASGASAVVLPSLFEEQIEHEAYEVHQVLEYGAESSAEHAGGFLPEMQDYNTGPERYLELVRNAKEAVSIPVIGSLNGASPGGWTEYARMIEDAGADALELNIYFVAANLDETGAAVEARYLRLVQQVRTAIRIPLAVKIGPYFSSIGHFCRLLVEAGADGLVLFNRFNQPDIDLETLEVLPRVRLTTSDSGRLTLRWIAILRGRIEASLAATTGVHTADDVLKLILSGADATMMASALLKHGPVRLATVLDGVRAWLEEHDYESIEQMKGSLSQQYSPDPAAFERANYMDALVSYTMPRV
ncbi:MAG TPA: dihydroorotate dehydrogenase-like protein [Acidimicrobiia bacterium]|nr:dihydroorotate dehydrogenase-like protein [Acidimicrobiia bacterium]